MFIGHSLGNCLGRHFYNEFRTKTRTCYKRHRSRRFVRWKRKLIEYLQSKNSNTSLINMSEMEILFFDFHKTKNEDGEKNKADGIVRTIIQLVFGHSTEQENVSEPKRRETSL